MNFQNRQYLHPGLVITVQNSRIDGDPVPTAIKKPTPLSFPEGNPKKKLAKASSTAKAGENSS